MEALGRHLLMECFECNEKINDTAQVEAALREAVARSRVTLLQLHTQTFEPQGVSGFALIAESHLAVHTWPEQGYLALDVFTCGVNAAPEAAVEVFKEHFRPRRVKVLELPRGTWP